MPESHPTNLVALPQRGIKINLLRLGVIRGVAIAQLPTAGNK